MAIETVVRSNQGIITVVRPVMHLVSAISFWYGIIYFSSEVHFPISSTYVLFGGKFKYLTFLNAVNITIFLIHFISMHHGTTVVMCRRKFQSQKKSIQYIPFIQHIMIDDMIDKGQLIINDDK